MVTKTTVIAAIISVVVIGAIVIGINIAVGVGVVLTADNEGGNEGSEGDQLDATTDDNEGSNEGGGQLDAATIDAATEQSIASRIDRSEDPCQDFYGYACGGFLRNALSDETTTTVDDALRSTINTLVDILENGLDRTPVEALRKARQLYDTCTDTRTINSRGVQPLLDLIRDIGGWPLIGISESSMWNINGVQFQREKEHGSSALFRLSVLPDHENSSEYLLQVQQSGLTFPIPAAYSHSVLGPAVESFVERFIRQVLDMLNPRGSSFTHSSAASRIYELERRLAQIWERPEDTRDNDRSYNRMTIGDLSSLWPEYDWVTGIQTFLQNVAGVTVNSNESINVRTPEYFRRLSSVFRTTSTGTLRDYAKWHLVLQFLAFLDEDCTASVRNFRRALTKRAVADPTRSNDCAAVVTSLLPLAISRPYVERVLSDEARENVSEMVEEVRSAWMERIDTRTWLDDFSSDASKDKVEAISTIVGYPDRILDDNFLNSFYDEFEVIQNDYFGTYLQYVRISFRQFFSILQQPVNRTQYLDIISGSYSAFNAFYFPNFNHMTFLAGIMASQPIYQFNWPIYLKYGAMGAIIGHEIGHGFDDQGRQFDLNGNFRQWWTDGAIQNFLPRAQCFVDQYSQYGLTDFPRFRERVNGQQTLGENIADDIGVKSSFQAYRNVASRVGLNPQSTISVGSMALTPDRLFFLAWAQVWCTSYEEDGVDYSLTILSDVHSPGPFRAFGPLVNSPEFAEAYNCPVGSRMNPRIKCSLW